MIEVMNKLQEAILIVEEINKEQSCVRAFVSVYDTETFYINLRWVTDMQPGGVDVWRNSDKTDMRTEVMGNYEAQKEKFFEIYGNTTIW